LVLNRFDVDPVGTPALASTARCVSAHATLADHRDGGVENVGAARPHEYRLQLSWNRRQM